jgi:hypothetical protein
MATPTVPDYVPIKQLQGGTGRSTAKQINASAREPRERTITVAAEGALLPIAYGFCELPGLLFARGMIGTDLVVGFLWCIGEINSIEEFYINDAAAPAGITVTHYMGTPTQGVDATLSSAIVAYNDTVRIPTPTGYRGIAYTVLRIPTGELDAFPRVRARLKGLKIGPGGTYTDTPAYFMQDIIEDSLYGLDLIADGVSDVADWNDSFLGETEVPRNRAFFVIDRSIKTAPNLLDILSEYAECWYVYEGDKIKLVPDAPDPFAGGTVISSDYVVEGTVQITTGDIKDTPTSIEFSYTDQHAETTPWGQKQSIHSLAGVAGGDFDRIPTSIRMEGVYREVEALNRSAARLARLSNVIGVSFVTTDRGLVDQVGDVVQLQIDRGTFLDPDYMINMLIRITSVKFAGPGRYRFISYRYDTNHYPAEYIAPTSTGTVPVGAIAMLSGSTLPPGWGDYTDADGKFIVGAGDTYEIGDTGGTASFTGDSGTTSVAGGHVGTSTYNVNMSGPGAYPVRNPSGWILRGEHDHTYSAMTINPNLYRRENRLAIKTGESGASIPDTIYVLGLGGLSQASMSKISSYANRFLKSASANQNLGTTWQADPYGTTGETSFGHIHSGGIVYRTGPFSPIYVPDESGGVTHAHLLTAETTQKLKRRGITLYGGTADYDVIPGVIFMWSGSIGSLPTDFVLCDGTNGTIDMRDYFCVLNGSSEVAPIGNNKASVQYISSEHAHTHTTTKRDLGSDVMQNLHSGALPHQHSWTTETDWMPPYYALAFIMYAPAG